MNDVKYEQNCLIIESMMENWIIGELCVWRGERAYRPNDANNFNEAEIDVLIEYLCTS